MNKLLERFLYVSIAFYLQGQRIEGLQSFVHCFAVRTNSLVASLTTKSILEDPFKRSWLESCLNLIEENIQKLLCILLNGDIDGLSFEVFEGEAELVWVVVLLLS